MRRRNKLHQDRPSSQAVPQQLLDLLNEHIPGFRDEKYAFEIAWMLWCCTNPDRVHRADKNAVWFHTDEIRRLFGEVKNFLNANRDASSRYFIVTRFLNGTQYPEDAYTNGYLPQPWMKKALNSVIECGQTLDYVQADGLSRRLYKRAICSTDVSGNVVRRWKDVNVPTLIPVNIENLRVLERQWACLLELNQTGLAEILARYDLKKASLERSHLQTQMLIAEAQGSRHPGMLSVRYVLHGSGRLYAEGLNLQSCKREIRQAALQGFWDVDISACHLSIMVQMAERFGVSCPNVVDYIVRKSDVRNQIARDIGISTRDAKKIITAVGYGAPRSTSYYTAIPQEIGAEKAEAFFSHPLYLGIKADVDAATEVILAKHPTKRNRLINLASRAIAKTKDDRRPFKAASLMAHLLQGVEAAALEAAVRVCKGAVLLLQHDGFTANQPVDSELLRRAVLDTTGYNLTFEVEQIQLPLADLSLTDLVNIKLNSPRKPSTHAAFDLLSAYLSGTMAFSEYEVPPVFPLPLPDVCLQF